MGFHKPKEENKMQQQPTALVWFCSLCPLPNSIVWVIANLKYFKILTFLQQTKECSEVKQCSYWHITDSWQRLVLFSQKLFEAFIMISVFSADNENKSQLRYSFSSLGLFEMLCRTNISLSEGRIIENNKV